MRMYYACPECRLVFGRENGYFTGAMFVSYGLSIPLLAALYTIIAFLSGWPPELVLLAAALYALPFAPALFRYSRVLWMHLNRVLDPNLESEQYLPPRRETPQVGSRDAA
jgi:hypothetical protein